MTEQSRPTAVSEPVGTIEALTYAQGADLSPDGHRVAWCASRIVDGAERITLRITTVGERDLVEVDCGMKSYDPTWSPDGTRIAFVSEHDEVPQVMVLTLDSMRIDRLTDIPRGVAGRPVWSPDGSRLAFAALSGAGREAGMPYRITRAIGWLDGVGLVDDGATDIYVVECDGGRLRRLTDDAWINGTPSWRTDSAELVYVATSGPDDWDPKYVVRSVSLDGTVGDVVHLSDVQAVAALPNGDVAVTSLGFATPDLGELVVVRGGERVEKRTDELELDVTGDVLGDMPVPYADPDDRLLIAGDEAYVRVQFGDRLEIHRVALTGPQSTVEVVVANGCAYPLALASGRLLYATGSLTSPPDLWVRDLTSGVATRVSFTAEQNADVLRAVEVEELNLPPVGRPSVDVKLLRPRGLSGPLPTVLLIHGGPKSAFGQSFFADAQLLCEAGFGVLMVNPRGSRGYGRDFASAITGNWGCDDYADLMAAVDLAIERGLADPDRLGVAGLSYGGYMTSWIVTQTNRFRAAVVENPVTNFWSMYGTSDIGLVFVAEILGGTPQTAMDSYLRSSPISNAHRCVTSTLIVQGEEDHRCPPEQSLQFYAHLKRAGCVAELLMLPGASHVGSISGPVAVRRAQNEALVEWMTRYVAD
ncbi:S9 family peptidase [Mycolicibacterium sp. YH-1]|uniref:S9 family peptidase n=1 Tax=Mycolicibacterium sp. YH-1 TaxID=2908837 RepID=UPI001F4BEF1E|nr:S9 family peptidase [Mycolicibacterium sp. YH-1]UNB55321.1 S9 family peptidase [Mycolicibacterium sp. YH-1]